MSSYACVNLMQTSYEHNGITVRTVALLKRSTSEND